MEDLRIGIIGLGVGEKHIDGYMRHPKCQVTAICDLSEKRLSEVRGKYPDAKQTKYADELLEDPDIDVVSIASYDNAHFSQVCKALNHDKHVFVEKPLCLHEEEAITIRNLMNQKTHLKLSSNLILRRSPRFQHLKTIIDSGGLGELFYLEGDYNYGRIEKITNGWRGDMEFYSVIYGGGVHVADLLLWLAGELIEEVSAFGNNISSKGSKFRYNDMVVSILKFKSGLIGKIAANFGCVFPHFHQLTVYGTRGTFVNGMKEAFLYKSRDPLTQPQMLDSAYPGVHKGELIMSFIDSILHGTVPDVSTDDVFNAMSVCFAVEKAVKNNSVIPVRYI